MIASSSLYQTPVEHVLDRLDNVRRQATGWIASCPVPTHGQGRGDRHPSLSIREGDDGRVLLYCHVGCTTDEVLEAIDLKMTDLFVQQPTIPIAWDTPSATPASPHHSGLTLEDYAAAKQLPVDFLKRHRVTEIRYLDQPAVRMAYLREDGSEGAVRFRVQLEATAGSDRFRWKKGTKPFLYGLQRLGEFKDTAAVVLVEGESDTQTAWYHDIPAIGLPGATNWREERDAHLFDGFARIYVVIEPDQGGTAVLHWLERSQIRDRVHLVNLDPYKDLSELHLSGADVHAVWDDACARAVPWTLVEQGRQTQEADEALAVCAELATTQDILAAVADHLEAGGVAGERRVVQLLYLILTSRVLPRPVNASIKGPSSSGKSYTLDRVLELFPPEAYHTLSAMSERALVYDTEPLQHRYLIIFEAAGLNSDLTTYFIRSLLSEGQVRYTTVEKTSEGIRARTIQRDGPTGFLTTTTQVHLHPENETRMLSIPTTDTTAQTAAILQAIASGTPTERDDTAFVALQRWIALATHEVVIPYAACLAAAIPPVAIRLRRDFGMLLDLVRTHAILHQATRDRDDQGRIIATIGDYRAVFGLVADLMSAGTEASVPATVRETVKAAQEVLRTDRELIWSSSGVMKSASMREIANQLGVDRSTASRRVRVAVEAGYLDNLEDKRGRPARVTVGDPLPEDHPLLPDPDRLAEWCTDAAAPGGSIPPPVRDKTATQAGVQAPIGSETYAQRRAAFDGPVPIGTTDRLLQRHRVPTNRGTENGN